MIYVMIWDEIYMQVYLVFQEEQMCMIFILDKINEFFGKSINFFVFFLKFMNIYILKVNYK